MRKPVNKNRIRGMQCRASWRLTAKPTSIKGTECKFGGCAQTAEISGVVRDKTGAVIPNASVTAVDESRGIKRSATSNGVGAYDLPFLKPDSYRVLVQANGFESIGRSGLTLVVGQSVNLDFKLEVGKVETTVEVKEAAPLISPDSSVCLPSAKVGVI